MEVSPSWITKSTDLTTEKKNKERLRINSIVFRVSLLDILHFPKVVTVDFEAWSFKLALGLINIVMMDSTLFKIAAFQRSVSLD